MNALRTNCKFIGGGASFIVGVWTLADLPVVNPWPSLVLGWTFVVLGFAIAAPALLDLLGVE